MCRLPILAQGTWPALAVVGSPIKTPTSSALSLLMSCFAHVIDEASKHMDFAKAAIEANVRKAAEACKKSYQNIGKTFRNPNKPVKKNGLMGRWKSSSNTASRTNVKFGTSSTFQGDACSAA